MNENAYKGKRDPINAPCNQMSEQPHPSDGSMTAKQVAWEMGEQPQEWTPGYVEEMFDRAPAKAGSFFVAIAAAHNTALAAEREKGDNLLELSLAANAALAAERERYENLERSILDLSHPNCKGLRAERNDARSEPAAERCEDCNSELSQCGPQGLDGEPSMDCLVCKLREQLAAEREDYEKILNQLYGQLDAERKDRDDLAFRLNTAQEQLAAERGKRKALVEALEWVMDNTTQDRVRNRLAKVKEGE
jgi:hypothetical protein